MKKQHLIILSLITTCLTSSCIKKEPVEEDKFIINDHIINSGAAWFLEKVKETDLDKILKEVDSILHITVELTDTTLSILKDDSIVLASSYYHEYHHYIADDDSHDFMVKYEPAAQQMPKHPNTGRDMKLTERKDVLIFAADDPGIASKKAYYHEVFRTMLFNKQGEMATHIEPGDTVYALTTTIVGPCVVTENIKKKLITPHTKALEFYIYDLDLIPVSLYDFLDYHLKRITVAYLFLNKEKKSEKEIPEYRVRFVASENVTKEVEKQIIYCFKDKELINFEL